MIGSAFIFILFLIVLHMGHSFHFGDRVKNVEYISLYTNAGEIWLLCTLSVYVIYFYS